MVSPMYPDDHHCHPDRVGSSSMEWACSPSRIVLLVPSRISANRTVRRCSISPFCCASRSGSRLYW